MKLVLVYLIASLLLNNNPTVVLPDFFVNNLKNVNNFPWGKAVWEDNTTRIKKQAQNKWVKFERGITNSHYNLYDFHLPLQVWLYELFPSVSENFTNRVNANAILRIFASVPSEQPTFARVDEVLSLWLVIR